METQCCLLYAASAKIADHNSWAPDAETLLSHTLSDVPVLLLVEVCQCSTVKVYKGDQCTMGRGSFLGRKNENETLRFTYVEKTAEKDKYLEKLVTGEPGVHSQEVLEPTHKTHKWFSYRIVDNNKVGHYNFKFVGGRFVRTTTLEEMGEDKIHLQGKELGLEEEVIEKSEQAGNSAELTAEQQEAEQQRLMEEEAAREAQASEQQNSEGGEEEEQDQEQQKAKPTQQAKKVETEEEEEAEEEQQKAKPTQQAKKVETEEEAEEEDEEDEKDKEKEKGEKDKGEKAEKDGAKKEPEKKPLMRRNVRRLRDEKDQIVPDGKAETIRNLRLGDL